MEAYQNKTQAIIDLQEKGYDYSGCSILIFALGIKTASFAEDTVESPGRQQTWRQCPQLLF